MVTPAGETFSIRGQSAFIRQVRVTVVDGVDRDATVTSQGDELTIGTSEGTDLRLTDPSVSRHHCVLRAHARGLEVRDLGSTNGVVVGGVELFRANITHGTQLVLGKTRVRVDILDDRLEQPLATEHGYGGLLGASIAMRRLYPVIARYAASDGTVLVHGETGTGKELVAEAIHDRSSRRARPFVIVNCGALPRELAESELFGHARGAFTGADVARIGAFETAQGGTVFLDEIGELPLALQPLLLRVLESRTVRRIGEHDQRAVDVRVIAASHRDLRVAVNEKRFRSDLFYRLDVLRLAIPPLREREGDVAQLADAFWTALRPGEPLPAELRAHLVGQSWPGNVRELRNTVERAALVGLDVATGDVTALTYGQAKERALAQWEAGWVTRLVAAYDGNLTRASKAVKMGRTHLREMARRHGVVPAALPASACDQRDGDDGDDDDE